MGRALDEELGLIHGPSFEEKREALKMALGELGLDENALAKRLDNIGDVRDLGTKIRDIRQMIQGRKEVPSELLVVLELLKRQVRRIDRIYGQLTWYEADEGSICAEAEGFAIRLLPKSRGRYRIVLQHLTSTFSPTWPKWQIGIERAKFIALLALDDALSQLDQLSEEGEVSRS